MSVILYKDGGETLKVEPLHLQSHLDGGWRLTKEAVKVAKKRGPKPKKVSENDDQD